MSKASTYESKPTGKDGRVTYSDEEEGTWRFLVERQNKAIQGRACQEFLIAVKKFNLFLNHCFHLFSLISCFKS